MSKPRAQWIPNASLEQDKLAPKETDWNLAGATNPMSRTRHGGEGRPNMNIKKLALVIMTRAAPALMVHPTAPVMTIFSVMRHLKEWTPTMMKSLLLPV